MALSLEIPCFFPFNRGNHIRTLWGSGDDFTNCLFVVPKADVAKKFFLENGAFFRQMQSIPSHSRRLSSF